MENKLIIDTSSGTIVSLQDCRVVDADLLPLHHTMSDGEVSDLADRVGHKVIDPCDYTEADALDLVSHWAKQYGWKYAVFTRDDVRQACVDLDGDGPTLELRVDAVMATRMWVKTLEDSVIREGMECVYDAIEQAKQGV